MIMKLQSTGETMILLPTAYFQSRESEPNWGESIGRQLRISPDARKIGYVQEGVLRQSVFKDGVYKNQVLYALLKEEYKQADL